MKRANISKSGGQERRWVLFSNGCVHGVRHSHVTVLRTRPRHHCLEQSSVSVFSISRAFGLCAGLAALGLLLLLLAACQLPRAQRGGGATTVIQRGGYTNSATLSQSDNPKEPSRQTVLSEQTLEYVLPAGTVFGQAGSELGRESRKLKAESGNGSGNGSAENEGPSNGSVVRLEKAMPVRRVARDRTETMIGGAQKDTLREWAGRAANMQPVMWAGILMMTLVAGVLGYFGWWTKAGVAVAVGAGMVGLAQTLPDHGGAILLGGLALFALIALLILYAYYKGQLDRNQDGIPDLLQKSRRERADLNLDGRAGLFPGSATQQGS